MATEKTTLEKFKEVIGDKLKEVKQLFEVPVVEPTPAPAVTFVDVKTNEGAILRIDGGTQVGSKCTLISAEGETPADGAYTLEDGTALVAKAGVIETVTPGEAKPAADDPNKMNELAEVKDQVKSITYKYAEIEKLIADKDKANAESFEAIKKDNEKLSAQNKAMFALIEQIAGLPAEDPTQTPKTPNKVGRLAEFRAEVKAIREARKESRN